MKSKFDWRSAYFNIVSLIAVIVFLIAAINAGHGLLRVLFPKMSLSSHEWQQVESFDAFKRGGPKYPRSEPIHRSDDEVSSPDSVPTSEEKLREQWEEYRTLALEGEKRRGVWSLLQALVSAVVAIPLFWWHRRGAERARKRDNDTE